MQVNISYKYSVFNVCNCFHSFLTQFSEEFGILCAEIGKCISVGFILLGLCFHAQYNTFFIFIASFYLCQHELTKNQPSVLTGVLVMLVADVVKLWASREIQMV